MLLYQRVTLAVGGALLALAFSLDLRRGARGRVLLWGHDHYHVAPVEVRLALDAPEVREVLGEPYEELLTQFRVLHLAPAEHDRDLHLVAVAQEALDVAALGVEVVVADLGPELYLADVDVDLLLAGGLTGLFLLVFVLAVVHDPDYRRGGGPPHPPSVQVGPLGARHP